MCCLNLNNHFLPLQISGTVIQLLAQGTESLHWRTDTEGYPVVRDPAMPERFVYAVYNTDVSSMSGDGGTRM